MEASIYFFTFGFIFLLNILSWIKNQHWVFRTPEFGKVQLLIFAIVLFILGSISMDWSNPYFVVAQLILVGLIIHDLIIILPYLPKKSVKVSDSNMYHASSPITILSVNVYQFNKEYDKFLQLVEKHDPHIVLTMESNKDWEQAMQPLEEKYKFHRKIALENTYGMHFYSRIKVLESKTNYFVADDIPSIEA
jgi:endonuclease/exonuclease/phosphatase (EEP) superfamily protein YafD